MVGLIKKLVNRFKDKQFIRYALVGCLNTVIGLGSYTVLVLLGVNYILSSFISSVLGVSNSYFCNKFFTFKSKKFNLPEMLRFISVYVMNYIVGVFILILFVEVFKMNKIIANYVLQVFATIVTYFAHRFFSFKSWGFLKKKKPEKVKDEEITQE
jgi:putative flippase GtrA